MEYHKKLLKYIHRHDPFAIHRLSVWLGNIFRPNAKPKPGKGNIRKIIRVYNSQKKSELYSEDAILKLREIGLGVGDYSKIKSLENEMQLKDLLTSDSPKLFELRELLNPSVHALKDLAIQIVKQVNIDAEMVAKIIDLHIFFTMQDFLSILTILNKNIDQQIVKAILTCGLTYPIHQELKKLTEPLSKDLLQIPFRQSDILEALKATVVLANHHCISEQTSRTEIEKIVSKPNAVQLAHQSVFATRQSQKILPATIDQFQPRV